MNNRCYRIVLFAAIVGLALVTPVIGEQTDAPKKPRRITNRNSPVIQPVQDLSNLFAEDSHPERPTYAEQHTDQYVEEGGDFSSDVEYSVVQAGCKNCQSSRNQMQASGPDRDAQEVVYESEDVVYQDTISNSDAYSSSSFSQSMALGCDEASCYDSRGACHGIVIDPCSPLGLLNNRLFVRAQQAFFWGGSQQLPALVVSNPPGLPAQNLFGGGTVGSDSVSGFRFESGLWLDACESSAIVVRGFYGGENDIGLVTDSNQFPNLALVYNQPNPNGTLTPATALISAAPGLLGAVNANLSSNVYGGDILFKKMIARDHLGRWDWLMGYQTARLSESLTINSIRDTGTVTPPTGIRNTLTDSFQVKNQFHGATFGISGDVREGNWYFGGMFKLGLGNMERQITIQGNQVTEVRPGPPVLQDTGLYASTRTNAGSYTFDTFVMSPELALTAGYRLTRKLDFSVGYNMLRLPKVTRVANALDPRLAVNLNDTPNQPNPAFDFAEFNFTLHSLNLGLQWNY